MSDPMEAESDRLSVKTQRISYYLFAALMAAVLFGPGGGGSGQRLVEGLAEGAGGAGAAAADIPEALAEGATAGAGQ